MIYLLYFYIASVIVALCVTALEALDNRYNKSYAGYVLGIPLSFVPIVNLFALSYFFW